MPATRKPRRTKTLESIIGSALRPRVPGAFYKLAPASASLAMDVQTEAPYVDRGAMSAKATISTPVMDRYGDVLIPEGIKLDNYRKNPVVLWAHGFDGITTPIGKSEDPDGNLTVRVNSGAVEATCFFSQSNLEAAQIFELICEGIVKATSVRETPIKSSYSRDPELGDYLLVEEWDLEEWSWCCVGVNPEAVAKAQDVLKRGRLDGVSIAPSIMKSLSAICPAPKGQGIGVDMSTAKAKKDDEKPDAKDPAKEPADDAASQADVGAQEAEQTDGEEDKGEDSSQLYGHQYTVAAHSSLADCVKCMKAGLVPCENETIRSGMKDIISGVEDQQMALQGLHSKAYPDSKAFGSDEGSETDVDGDSMKAWLAAGKGRDLQVFGVASQLKKLAAAKNLTKEQVQLITGVEGHLNRLASQCKAAMPKKPEQEPAPVASPAEDPEAIAALQKKIDELEASLN